MCLLVRLQVALRKPKMRMGTYDPTGTVTWHDNEPRNDSRIFWEKAVKIDRDGNEIKPVEDAEGVEP